MQSVRHNIAAAAAVVAPSAEPTIRILQRERERDGVGFSCSRCMLAGTASDPDLYLPLLLPDRESCLLGGRYVRT